jgi:NADH-quinone oxidoreductase subunit N
VGTGLIDKLEWIKHSLGFFIPELILTSGVIIVLISGLISRKSLNNSGFHLLSLLVFIISFSILLLMWPSYETPVRLFEGMVRHDNFSTFLRLLFDVAGMLTVLMTCLSNKKQKHLTEYYALIFSMVLGAHLLVMSLNFMMIFLSLELLSISGYILAGFAFNRPAAEGSLKYFLFGSVASAVMLYGLSIFYGLTGTLDFSSQEFINGLIDRPSPLILTAGLMTMAGFLYKIAAAPMHPWSPDIYEAAPMPVVAFFSVVPKLAGIGVLVKFVLALNLFGQSVIDWQLVVCVVAILTLTIGNFSALNQKSPKRMMAYSSIAQSGFLLVGVATLLPQGTHVMLFYAGVYLLANFLTFILLQYFESNNIHTIAEYSGVGKIMVWPSVLILVGLITLTGLPPTSGFTAKLFIFSSLWDAYAQTGKSILLWLLIFGLLNTVVSLFYYLRIPYYAFLKSREAHFEVKKHTSQNLLALILVMGILILFFLPGLLMGWINKINFVL